MTLRHSRIRVLTNSEIHQHSTRATSLRSHTRKPTTSTIALGATPFLESDLTLEVTPFWQSPHKETSANRTNHMDDDT